MFSKENTISFPDKYWYSGDKKSILGETLFKDILFLDYRDSEAGSNPREYNGLKKSNIEIIKSLLKDPKNMFRFLHSGMIVSLTGLSFSSENTLKFKSCCLTNGNQTRFIILILALLKYYTSENLLENITAKSFHQFLKENLRDEKVISFLKFVKFGRVNEIVSFIKGEGKYQRCFNELKLEDFLTSKIRIQINVIDRILDAVDELDEYSAGTLIAGANNETQKVAIDDIFGSRYKRELKDNIFKEFENKYGESLKIEYRLGEIVEKGPKVHILTLLRPVVSTGILTKEKDIHKYANQRIPIYNLFIKLIKNREKAQETIQVISKLIPFLYQIRENYVLRYLRIQKEIIYRDIKEKALLEELGETSLRDKIRLINNNELTEESDKAIKKMTNYNIEHIFPVIVFRIRKILKYSKDGNEINLTIDEKNYDEFFKTIVNSIYKKYIDTKLVGTSGSITDEIRNKHFFTHGEEAYEAEKNHLNFKETNLIQESHFKSQ
ncbi:MAG: hypothetical protein ABSE95_04945 [Thermodesulfobacteriota bacterium]|jgi:hypothetical protein